MDGGGSEPDTEVDDNDPEELLLWAEHSLTADAIDLKLLGEALTRGICCTTLAANVLRFKILRF